MSGSPERVEKEPPFVTIVMPVLNMEAYLPQVLRRLLSGANGARIDEVIAVDNGSTDESMSILNSYSKITVLRQSVPGSYAARNLGIRHARGDLIFFLDSDCAPGKDWVSAAIEAMRDPVVHLLLGHRNYAHKGKMMSLLAGYENAKARWMLGDADPSYVYGYTNNMVVRRSVFDRIGLFEERARGADTLFVQQLIGCLGRSAARFCDAMDVDHLEVQSVHDYYRKRAIYGSSNSRLSRCCPLRPIPMHCRLIIYRHLIGDRSLKVLDQLLLLGLLILGSLVYDFHHARSMEQG